MADEEKTQDEEEIVADDQQDNDQEKAEEEDKTDWKAEALKHKAIADRLKGKLAKIAPITNVSKEEHKLDEDTVKDVQHLKEVEAKRQFGFEHELSPKETDLAFKFANGKPTKKTLEDEFFKGGLESLRSKDRLAKNTPGSSSRSSVFSEKSFAETPEEDRKKSFEKAVAGIKK